MRLLLHPTLLKIVVVGSGRVLAALMGIATIRMFTEFVSPSTFGEVNLILGLVALGNQMIIAPLTEAQLRLYPEYKIKNEGGALLRVVFRYVTFGAIFLSSLICIILIIESITRSVDLPVSLGIILCSMAFITAFRNFGLNFLNSEHHQYRQTLWDMAESLLLLLIGMCLLSWRDDTTTMLLIYLGSISLPAMFFLLQSRRSILWALFEGRHEKIAESSVRADIMHYGWPFVVFSGLGWVMGLFDRYVIASQLDIAAVGQYAAAFAISSRMITMPTSVLATVFRPSLYDAAAAGHHIKWRKIALIWFSVLSVGSIAVLASIWTFANTIAEILLAERYRSNIDFVMFLVAISFTFLALAQFFEMLFLSFGKPRSLIPPRIAGAVFTIVSAFALIPPFGLTGAALCSIVGHCGLATFMLINLLPKLAADGRRER